MIFKLNLFWKELFLFGTTLLIGIFSAYNYRFLMEKTLIKPKFSSWDDIVVFLVVLAILSVVILKFKKFGALLLKFFLLLVVFSGSQTVFGSFISSPWDMILALIMVLFFMLIRNVFVHDLGMIIGLAGISSLLGITISPNTAVALLVILSFYDIIAVYWTKHMIYMAQSMIESGAIFGFIIPFEIKDIFNHKLEARQKLGDKFMILGSGDIGLPLILVSSLAVVSIRQSLVTALFALVGLFLTHLMFVNQEGRKPMAALPPIATLTIIGYIIASL